MSQNYDNWERLLGAVLRREQFRHMALHHSRNSSYLSDCDTSSDSSPGSMYPTPDLSPAPSRSSSPELQGHARMAPGVPFFLTVESRELTISCGENSQHPELIFNPDYSNLLVAKIDSVRWLDIRGTMKTRMMTSNTVYAAFLVYKLEGEFRGCAEAMIRCLDSETDSDAESRAEIVYLQQVADQEEGRAVMRKDGWMEVRLGEFQVGDKDDRDVEARLTEQTQWKSGLIVQGMEFRPVLTVSAEARSVAKTEEAMNSDIDISLLQQLWSSSVLRSTSPVPPASNSLEPTHHPDDDTAYSQPNAFCPDWTLTNNSSLQDEGIGVEMMSKLLLPEDDRALSSLTRDKIFSGGYGCLSEAVYFFHGMWKFIEHKEREIEDLKYKLLKCEIDAQFVIGAKDLEVEKLRKMSKALKGDLEKCEQKAKEEKVEASKKLKEVKRKFVNAEARAAEAVERFRNSEEMKAEKHGFASKAFIMGFELCKKQVAKIDPSFDIGRIDVKNAEAYSFSSS